MDKTILDELLSAHTFPSQYVSVKVKPDEIVHVAGSQEPVRDQPDERAKSLLIAGWLTIEHIRISLSEHARAQIVTELQQTARAWLKQPPANVSPDIREQVRWIVEKTRTRESKQQISQRVWLAVVLHNLSCQGLKFDKEGQILWEGGRAGRIGIAPDTALDLAWDSPHKQVFTASFRQSDGSIARGKGRRRWHIYRLSIAPQAAFLFDHRRGKVRQSVALIVASETFATQPQLPRDFYGGDAFQQACIDAQDQQFSHMLVLSPQHGVISLDDIVPGEEFWDDVIERRLWMWQFNAIQRLGMYLFGKTDQHVENPERINWWAWLNPDSVYEISVFGGGFVIRSMLEHLTRLRIRAPHSWPTIVVADRRPGYEVGDVGDDFAFDFEMDEELADESSLDEALQNIDQLLEWSTEFVDLVCVYVPPTGETWQLAPDEVLIPVRALAESDADFEELLDLLTDITLLLEQPLPVSMLINADLVVSALLQITHSLIHNERDGLQDVLDIFQEGMLRQYIENALQEPSFEDQLCACLTFAEQMQLLSMAIPHDTANQLLIWLQTYLAARMRQRILSGDNHDNRLSKDQ